MTSIPHRYADDLYDDLWFPDETLQVRAQVRSFAEEYVRPVAHALNNTPESLDAFPRELVAHMANAGLFCIPFSAEYGGAGLKYPTLATMVMLEEVAYLSSGLAAAMIDVQLILFGHTLKHASAEVREKLFPAMMAGDVIGSFATSEPAASTDLSLRALQTQAKRVDNGYELSGQKRWITNSPVADYMFVLSKLEEGMTMLLVDKKTDGVQVGEPDKKMGNHCQLTADIVFDWVFVPAGHLVGGEGQGLKAALTSLTLGRVGIGACGVGMAQAAFDFAVDYMKEREVFGKPLASMQYWQYRFEDYATQLECAPTSTSRLPWEKTGSGRACSSSAPWPSSSAAAWPAISLVTPSRSVAATASSRSSPIPVGNTHWRLSTGTARSGKSTRAPTRCRN